MQRWAFMCSVALVVACRPRATPTPAGTVFAEWNETTAPLSAGVSLGAPAGALVKETKTVEFTPNGDVRDKSLGPVKLELAIEREDVDVVPNAAGARPGLRAALPRHVTIKVVDAGGWQFVPTSCEPSMNGPGDIGERDARVGFFEMCHVEMRGGREDIASITVTIAGNGKHTLSAAFGTAVIR